MKCVKRGDEVRKVDDDKAEEMVRGGWSWCPRAEWKKTAGRAGEAPAGVVTASAGVVENPAAVATAAVATADDEEKVKAKEIIDRRASKKARWKGMDRTGEARGVFS
jgi:hypothetical protein